MIPTKLLFFNPIKVMTSSVDIGNPIYQLPFTPYEHEVNFRESFQDDEGNDFIVEGKYCYVVKGGEKIVTYYNYTPISSCNITNYGLEESVRDFISMRERIAQFE